MTARRRPALHKHQQTPPNSKDRGDKAFAMAAPSPRVINAAPSLEKAEMYGIDDNRPVFSRAMALAGRMFIETIPQWLAVGAMLSLIFGGCCSNVFALESIIKVEPASGRFLPLYPPSSCGVQRMCAPKGGALPFQGKQWWANCARCIQEPS